MEQGNRILDENLGDYEWKDNDGNIIEKKDLNNYFKTESENFVHEALEKYMSIGSVVKVQKKIGLYMIVGHKCKNNDVEFDYLAIRYPIGITQTSRFEVFNHEQIEKTHHIGLVNGMQIEYKKRLLGDNEGFSKTL